MGLRHWAAWLAVLCSVAAAHAREPAGPAAFYDPHRFWTIHVRVSAEAWDKMQPGGRRAAVFRPGGAVAGTQPEGVREERLEANTYGYQHAYVPGRVEIEGKSFDNAAVRFKGNSSYFIGSRTLKRPMKIDLTRFVDAAKADKPHFHGVTQITLNNHALDDSQMHEAVGYWVFRQAGVPAPRTTYALVYLTIDGRIRRECLGLYSVIEEIGPEFLRDRFRTDKGLLLKPHGEVSPFAPQAGADSIAQFEPETPSTPETLRALSRFAVAQRRGGDDFVKELSASLEVDQYLRFLACQVMLANMDSMLLTGHNYYLYVHPETLKATYVPWDLNLAFGGYGRAGAGEELMDLSIAHPHVSGHDLIDRVLAVEQFREQYHGHLKRFLETFFAPEVISAEIDALQRVVDEAKQRAGDAPHAKPPTTAPATGQRLWRAAPVPREFVRGRRESILRQLEGKSRGYVPRIRTGPISSFTGVRDAPAAPPYAASTFAVVDRDGDQKVTKEELDAAADGFYDAADSAKKDALDQAAVALAVQRLLPPAPPAAEAPFRLNPRMPRGRVGDGESLSRSIFYEADRDLDAWLARSELLAGARRLFLDADGDGDGSLNAAEFSAGLGRLAAGAAYRW